MTPKYTLREKALAVEMVVSGYTIAETSRILNISPGTISVWILRYFGYRGKEGITITKRSNINEELQEPA